MLRLHTTEWSRGRVINLGGLPGSINSVAGAINDAGQVVQESPLGGRDYATEWSRGRAGSSGAQMTHATATPNGSIEPT